MICQGRLVGSLLVLLSLTACGKGRPGWEAFPVPIYTQSSFLTTSQEKADFQEAMTFWETKAGKKLFDFRGDWNSANSPYTGEVSNPSSIVGNVIFFQNPWPFGATVVGETTVHTIDQKIQGAIIMINPVVRFCEGDCNGQEHLTSQKKTFTHELGHFIGLNHVQDASNIMYPNSVPGGSLKGVAVDDAALKLLTQE